MRAFAPQRRAAGLSAAFFTHRATSWIVRRLVVGFPGGTNVTEAQQLDVLQAEVLKARRL